MSQRLNATLNKRGVSLVEVMIAMVISLLVFFAVMQTALVGIDANMRNVLRDEAVNIAEMRLQEVRSVPFASLESEHPPPVQRSIRNVTPLFTFDAERWVDEIDGDRNTATDDGDIRRVIVTVTWQWKGQTFTHTATTIRKRE